MSRKKQSIVIVDTGCANVLSVRYAVERLDYQVSVSDQAEALNNADKLLLPGVGTAREAMENLEYRGLIPLLAESRQPVLGICLGMQLLGEFSEEADSGSKKPTPCLGFCDLPVHKMNVGLLPLPHMGWNTIKPNAEHSLFKRIPAGSYFYFVHSYAMPVLQNSQYTIATCEYGGVFSAAIQHRNYYGVQFHPERSGKMGLQLIKNFLELSS
ncbi:imidazole glycerol phosphate synthase subunit HisH [Endozoicomonas sp.]|nr:imidazole glycerol phosphate synthase subunit HisH [Endozoicomonas sp.]